MTQFREYWKTLDKLCSEYFTKISTHGTLLAKAVTLAHCGRQRIIMEHYECAQHAVYDFTGMSAKLYLPPSGF